MGSKAGSSTMPFPVAQWRLTQKQASERAACVNLMLSLIMMADDAEHFLPLQFRVMDNLLTKRID